MHITFTLHFAKIITWIIFFLSKEKLESIVQKERKPVAPSQRIIHRKSPKRKDRRAIKEEEEELLNYDSAPKACRHFRGASQTSDTDSMERQSNQLSKSVSDVQDKKEASVPSLPEEETISSTRVRPTSPQTKSSQQRRYQSRTPRGEMIETNIDFPHDDQSQAPSKVKRGSDSSQESANPINSTTRSSGSTSSSRGTGAENSSMKALKGPYVPQSQKNNSKEYFV